ncbi:MAG: ParB/Srx family N-terminal domain-containing protein [Clostridia bacterium]
MNVQQINIFKIQPYKLNAKIHTREQINLVAKSIKEFGMVQPVVVDRDFNLIIGHCRLEACKELDFQEIPAVIAEELNEEQIKALRLADNKTNESEWDFNLLAESLDEINDIDMSEFNFDLGVDMVGFGENFSLNDEEKSPIGQMTFTLHEKQKEVIDQALREVKPVITETFGNENSNGNAIYEVVKQ